MDWFPGWHAVSRSEAKPAEIEMTLTLYGIPNCDTVRKARAWFAERGIAYDFVNYKTAGVDPTLLAGWVDALGWEAVLNRSGNTFRKLPEAERERLDAPRAIALMLAHPSAIRRPMLVRDGAPPVAGFAPDRYAALFD